jgi:plastocyanin
MLRFTKQNPAEEIARERVKGTKTMNIVSGKTNLLMYVLLASVLTSGSATAASFSMTATDAAGKPVIGVVAALVPDPKPAFTEKAKAIMDQRNKQFTPGVLAVRTNTLVYFPNSDDVRHQVYSFSPAKRFELRLYHGRTAEPVLFDRPGQVILGCNIHDSMVAYIYVVDSEYFAVANDQGQLNIANIPAGNYSLEVYQPKLSAPWPAQKISLTQDQHLQQKITLSQFVEDKKPAEDSLDNLFK